MKTKHLFLIIAIAFTFTGPSYGLTQLKIKDTQKQNSSDTIELNSIVSLHPNDRAFSIKEAQTFPKGCISQLKISKGLQNHTLQIMEQESENCGELYQKMEPLSLSFQEEVDHCGVVKTNFYSQNNTLYEILDSTATKCDQERSVLILISPLESDQASIKLNF